MRDRFEQIISRLKLAQQSKRLTNEQLGKELGITGNAIWNAFHRKSFSVDKIEKLSRFMGVNPEWLEDGTGSMFLSKAQMRKMQTESGLTDIDSLTEQVQSYRDEIAELRRIVLGLSSRIYRLEKFIEDERDGGFGGAKEIS